MSAKHRTTSKAAAKRAAVTAGAIGATAGLSMMGAPAQAAAPDYSQVISDYSHALDNLLGASNNTQTSANSVWGPIAGQSAGILPTFASSFTKSDATKITDLPAILRNIGSLNLPTGVPGVVPNLVLPGGQAVTLPLPTTLPGGGLLVTAANALDGLVDNPLAAPVLDRLPALSELIDGLEATQSKYSSSYDWSLLGMSGETNFLNTFVTTPSGLKLNGLTLPGLPGLPPITLPDIPLLPDGTLPSGTIWVPQGDGTYTFPLGAKAGWWGAAPTAALKLPASLGGSETVLSVPIGAAGFALPLNLVSAGTLGANVLLPTQNGVYSPIGFTMNTINTALGFGLTNLNVTTGNYLGTNGINVNNGQNLALLQNPLGIPLPLIYGLGGFSVGTEGMGLKSPSLFGIKLFTDLAIGGTVGPNSPAGLIPSGLLPTDPMGGVITAITGGLGVGSLTQILGLDAVIVPVTTVLGQGYTAVVTPILTPLSDLATQQYGPLLNGSASSILDLSKALADRTADLPGARPSTESATTTEKVGAHSLENGGEPVSSLAARLGTPTVDEFAGKGDAKPDDTAPTGTAPAPSTPEATAPDAGTTAPPETDAGEAEATAQQPAEPATDAPEKADATPDPAPAPDTDAYADVESPATESTSETTTESTTEDAAA